MSSELRLALHRPDMPENLRSPEGWPAPMRAEWADDDGRAAAALHRERLAEGFRRLRAEIDAFAPDAIVVFNKDHYENVREFFVPPFCVYAFDEAVGSLYKILGRTFDSGNVWGEPPDRPTVVKGHPEAAKDLTARLLRAGFDVTISFRLLPGTELPHNYSGVVGYLDWDRVGFEHPVIPFHVNCYGGRRLAALGRVPQLSAAGDELPPPRPDRCFDLGAAVAQAIRESPYRVVLLAGSSWSQASVTAKNHWLHPDVESDRARYEDLERGDYHKWRAVSPAELEAAGQLPLLTWYPVVGAAAHLGYRARYLDFVPSYIFNSDKVFAVFGP
jgi:hypothetical protein